MTKNHNRVQTERLDLSVFSLALIDAFEANNRPAADLAAGASFPVPFAPPPETGDVLDYFRQMILTDKSDGLFLPRLIINRQERAVVGSIGVNPPDEHGVSLAGYSIYPLFEGNGYASEAARGLVDYAFVSREVRCIRATIEVSNRASQKVARRAGLINTNQMLEDDGMTLSIWERARDQS